MKKVLLLFAILLAMPVVANAQTETQRLVVWLKSGQKVYHDLSDELQRRPTVAEDRQGERELSAHRRAALLIRRKAGAVVDHNDSPRRVVVQPRRQHDKVRGSGRRHTPRALLRRWQETRRAAGTRWRALHRIPKEHAYGHVYRKSRRSNL